MCGRRGRRIHLRVVFLAHHRTCGRSRLGSRCDPRHRRGGIDQRQTEVGRWAAAPKAKCDGRHRTCRQAGQWVGSGRSKSVCGHGNGDAHVECESGGVWVCRREHTLRSDDTWGTTATFFLCRCDADVWAWAVTSDVWTRGGAWTWGAAVWAFEDAEFDGWAVAGCGEECERGRRRWACGGAVAPVAVYGGELGVGACDADAGRSESESGAGCTPSAEVCEEGGLSWWSL